MEMVRVVMGQRRLYRDEFIPGTSITADEVMQNGLVRFEAIDDSDHPSSYLTVPSVWLLALAASPIYASPREAYLNVSLAAVLTPGAGLAPVDHYCSQ